MRKFLQSETAFERIFQLWFLSFPFGASFLTFSFGFFTLYPFLILSALLFAFTCFHKPLHIGKFYKLTLGFFLLWILYGIVQIIIIPAVNYSDAKYEIRNLFLFFVTIFLIIQSTKILGWDKFKKNIGDLSMVIFVVFIIICLFEYLSGIHIASVHTEKILQIPVSSFTYAPVFIYENPNNFYSYFVVLALIVIIFNDKINSNFWAIIGINFSIFFVAFLVDSRFGKISSYIIFIVTIALFVRNIKISYYFIVIGIVLLCYFSRILFFGPIWRDGRKYQLNEMACIISDSTLNVVKIKELHGKYPEDTILKKIEDFKKTSQNSDNIRVKLLENGWYLFQKSHYLGVGPGQFISHHRFKNVPNDVGSHLNPHSWIIEILSQYGIFIFLGYISLFVFILIQVLRSFKKKINISTLFLLSIMIFFITGNIPSAFLLLDFNWMFTSLIFVFYCNEFSNK